MIFLSIMGLRGLAFKVRPIAVPIYRLSSAVLDCHSSSVLPDQVGPNGWPTWSGKTELKWQSDTVVRVCKSVLRYSTVSTGQLLFVWCSLSDHRQTIVRCLSVGPSDICQLPPDICQLPPDICQTRTTYKLHQICAICPPDIYYTICTPDVHQTSTRYLTNIWCLSGVYVILVWQMSGWSWHMDGESSGRHLTVISTRQTATVWRKWWCRSDLKRPTSKTHLAHAQWI